MPAVGPIYQATYIQHLLGQAMETVIHFRDVPGLSTPAALAGAADHFWLLLRDVQANVVDYTQLVLKQMTPIPFDEQLLPPVSAIHGNLGSTTINNTLAVVITKRTGTAGKTHRGRMYIGGMSGVDTDGNMLNTTGVPRFTAFCDAVMAYYGPTGTSGVLQLGVYSRVIGGSSPFTEAGWQPVTRLDVQTVLGNQRRRRLFVGI